MTFLEVGVYQQIIDISIFITCTSDKYHFFFYY